MKDTRIVPDSSQYQLWRDDKHVATVYNHDDARLFNAAPDLLAACEAVLNSIEFCEAILPRALRQQVGEAIAKARAR